MNGFSPLVSRMVVYLMFEMLAGLFLVQMRVLHELNVSIKSEYATAMLAIMGFCLLAMGVELARALYERWNPGGGTEMEDSTEQEVRYKI